MEGAVKPFLLSTTYIGGRPTLPMIDLAYSKEAAVPPHIWGTLYDQWTPNMEAEGLSVFLQAYENRGTDNERKRIYYSALTSDLYASFYSRKIRSFFDRLFDERNVGKPIMQAYYAQYFDLYWDLHLGVSGHAIPKEVKEIGTSFNTVIGYWYPTLEVVYQNYMRVRALRQPLKDWLDARVQDIIDERTPDREATFVYYWLKNGGLGENFRRKDIVFECFHNFLAFSQWGNTFYRIMRHLCADDGNTEIQAWFARTMNGEADQPQGRFSPLEQLAMELMRVISPNSGSYSTLKIAHGFLGSGYAGILHPHLDASRSPLQWPDPESFNPQRYEHMPSGSEGGAEAAGLATCPFPHRSLRVKDGRELAVANTEYGAVYAVANGEARPICDHAGYAPFGFGYRRCPGEVLTIEALKDFLRKIWTDRIKFDRIKDQTPERLPVGPGVVIDDDVAFSRS